MDICCFKYFVQKDQVRAVDMQISPAFQWNGSLSPVPPQNTERTEFDVLERTQEKHPETQTLEVGDESIPLGWGVGITGPVHQQERATGLSTLYWNRSGEL